MTQYKNAPPAGVLETVKCNLCGGSDFKVKYDSPAPLGAPGEMADYLASTDRYGRYGRIVKCPSCGLVFTNPRPPTENLVASYCAAVDPDYTREDASRGINAFLSLATIRKFVKGGRLLDIGCATGFFLNVARSDFEAAGAEPSEWAAGFARKKFGLDVTCGDFQKMDFAPESFDAVTMIDVIEHLCDPSAAVEKVAGVLKPSGYIYLVTPNIESFSARVLRGKWWGLRPAHLYYFSVPTLSALLASRGFEIVMARSFGRIFSYGYWADRLKNYNPLFYKVVRNIIKAADIAEKFVYINTRDSMEIVARKIPRTGDGK